MRAAAVEFPSESGDHRRSVIIAWLSAVVLSGVEFATPGMVDQQCTVSEFVRASLPIDLFRSSVWSALKPRVRERVNGQSVVGAGFLHRSKVRRV